MGDGKPKVGIILVGHGQLPKDLPQDLRHEYLSLKHKRRKPPEEEAKLESLERIVLEWPRNDSNDPYAHSLKLLAEELRRMGEYDRVWVAFKE
ncbi:MAG: hypothetical protein QXD32_03440, partial [Nitrososphaerota archaeon]